MEAMTALFLLTSFGLLCGLYVQHMSRQYRNAYARLRAITGAQRIIHNAAKNKNELKNFEIRVDPESVQKTTCPELQAVLSDSTASLKAITLTGDEQNICFYVLSNAFDHEV